MDGCDECQYDYDSEDAADADALAATFGDLDAARCPRTGIYVYPKGEERSMIWVSQRTMHEVPHLLDLGRPLRAARGC